MKKLFVAAGIFALAATLGVSEASAQGKSGAHGGRGASSYMMSPGSNQGGRLTGLDRADFSAGKHGAKGRAKAHIRGANKEGFCPPGQAKKSGQGSRFAC